MKVYEKAIMIFIGALQVCMVVAVINTIIYYITK
jgi:uncharacterized membrane protein